MNNRRGQRQNSDLSANPEKVGWRPREWGDAVGLCRATVYNLMNESKIASVKSGSARIIITAPAAYLASLTDAM